jgi:hypothetical protein
MAFPIWQVVFRGARAALALVLLVAFSALHFPAQERPAPSFVVESDVFIPMRDRVRLQADIWRPAGDGKFPTLVYRTPYSRKRSAEADSIFRQAVERGYAVVMQDVRGRYGSEGEFNPYFQEGRDGFDTIEWAAAQPWSSGEIGTFGLSYPGAVQWLAAIEGPPHLKAMVPAMTFSTPRNFIYSGGAFDCSWPLWIWNNIAPDVRARKNLDGPRTGAEARRAWPELWKRMQHVLPLSAVVELRDVAPWYYEWLRHPPEDSYWDALDLRDKYAYTRAAVLNFSGWYDEAYGPEGATTNFMGLMDLRGGTFDPAVKLIIGPWTHGVPGPGDTKAGERDFGPQAAFNYNEMVLRWMDRYVRGLDNGVEREPRVRIFLMGANRWVDSDQWPLSTARRNAYFLSTPAAAFKFGKLSTEFPGARESASLFVSKPDDPVTDPYPPYTGAHDYSALAQRSDVLVWETPPLERDLTMAGHIEAVLYIEADAPDTDIWVKLLDVSPDGKAISLMSPGLDVLRASYRDPQKRQLLEPGQVIELRLKNLLTGNVFLKGHRIRAQISATFFPHFSRNLHSALRETWESGEMRKATIRVHHDAAHASRLILPVVLK